MSHSAINFANNFLEKSFEENIFINSMKLQKMMYFGVQYHYMITGEYLLSEPFLTWLTGPVLHSVHDMFSPSENIKNYGKDAKGKSFTLSDRSIKYSVDTIWSHCKNKDGIELCHISRQEGSAWDKAYQSDKVCLDFNDVKKDFTFYDSLSIPIPNRDR